MRRLFFTLFLLIATSAFAVDYTACGTWAHCSAYGQGADVANYTYEVRVSLNCNSYEKLKIFDADSSTAITAYWVVDWSDDTLTVYFKPGTVTAGARDSVYIMRSHDGTAPDGSSTFLLFEDFSDNWQATPTVAPADIANLTRFSVDTNTTLIHMDTVGTAHDGYREWGGLTIFQSETLYFTSQFTGTYGVGQKYGHVWKLTNGVWADDGVIDSTLDMEQLRGVVYHGGESLGVYYEDGSRADGLNLVGFVATADRVDWTAGEIVIDSSYIFGGGQSPSSPPCTNIGDSLFYVFTEIKGDTYRYNGVTYETGGGAKYLYRGNTPRDLTRVINPLTNSAGGDTLVPIIPFWPDSTWGDSAGVPDILEYIPGVGHVLSAHMGYVNGAWSPIFAIFDSLAYSKYDYQIISALSGPATIDSQFGGRSGTYTTWWPYTNSLHAFGSDDFINLYYSTALKFDTTGHPYSGWSFYRGAGAENCLGYANTENGVLRLMGEQSMASAMGLKTTAAVLDSNFEVLWKTKQSNRGGLSWSALSIGSGNITNLEDNSAYYQVPTIESGVVFRAASTTSLFYDMPASGAKEALSITIGSPALTSWTEWRVRQQSTPNNTSRSRWVFKYDNTLSRQFTNNANGLGHDYNLTAKSLMISGGASGAAVNQYLSDFTETDYIAARKMPEVEAFAAPGIVHRDSIPVSKVDYLYEGALYNNRGGYPFAIAANLASTKQAAALTWYSRSGIPATAQILSATLFMKDSARVYGTAPINIAAYRITQDWVLGALTDAWDDSVCSWTSRGAGVGVGGTTIAIADSAWTTAGGTVEAVYTDGYKISGATTPALGWNQFDITEIERKWQSGSGNFGVALKETRLANLGEANYNRFHSETTPVTTNRPYAIVYWTEPSYNSLTLDNGLPDASGGSSSGWQGAYRNAIRAGWRNTWQR